MLIQRMTLLWWLCWIGILIGVVALVVVDAQEDKILVEQRLVVQISYQDLLAFSQENPPNDDDDNDESSCHTHDDDSSSLKILTSTIADAFGPEGLGFLEVTEIPPEMVALRTTVLNLAKTLAELPPQELDRITLPEEHYAIGWSHGKERFKGKADHAKGSFYFDPFVLPSKKNVFPSSLQPLLEDSLIQMTHFMTKVGLWIAQLVDLFLNMHENSDDVSVYKSLQTQHNTKARLLYYFPTNTTTTTTTTTQEDDDSSLDDWCGWHKDHGSLTALLPGHFFGNNATTNTNTGTGGGGLYIQTPYGVVPAPLSSTSLGFQLGETVELFSRGKLRATPHAVKSSGGGGGGRSSLAVFLQPLSDQPLPPLVSTNTAAAAAAADASLQARWRPTFGAFQQATLQAFQ